MWKLSIEDDQGATTVVQLARTDYTLGRDEANTIRLTERNISRRHARLVKQESNWNLIDLGSYNGCFVNGVRAGEIQPVGPRDLIQLGDYRLEFITDESLAVTRGGMRSEGSQSVPPTELNSTSRDRLVMVVGPTPGREYPLSEQKQSVGRGDDSDIAVNHPSVSRHHAEIHFLQEHHYEIIDKKSSNGLRINGVELERGLIEAHDVIEFGDVILKFIPAGQVYRPTPEETEKLTKLLGVTDGSEALGHSARLKLAWSGMSRSVRFGVSLLGSLVVLMFVAVVVTGRPLHVARPAPAVPTAMDSNAKFLQDAKERSAAGKLDEAHALLQRIAENSDRRQDPSFAEIEAKWADVMFDRAQKATTGEEKRVIYDTLLHDSALDGARRTRAQDSLSLLRDNVVAAGEAAPAKAPEPTEVLSAPSDAKNRAEIAVATRSNGSASGSTPNTTARNVAAKAVAPAAAAASPNVGSGPSRELAQNLAKKNQLKAKVATGNSTDQERRLLRALCRQLNDTSCSR